MYNLTDYWKKNRCINRRRSPTTWLNGRGSHFAKTVTVTMGRNGSTTTTSKEAFDDYSDYLKPKSEVTIRSRLMYQEGALSAIEQILDIKLDREYNIDNYLVDGYDRVNNVVYEVDEPHHIASKKTIEKDRLREERIKEITGCEFVRIKIAKWNVL